MVCFLQPDAICVATISTTKLSQHTSTQIKRIISQEPGMRQATGQVLWSEATVLHQEYFSPSLHWYVICSVQEGFALFISHWRSFSMDRWHAVICFTDSHPIEVLKKLQLVEQGKKAQGWSYIQQYVQKVASSVARSEHDYCRRLLGRLLSRTAEPLRGWKQEYLHQKWDQLAISSFPVARFQIQTYLICSGRGMDMAFS